MKKAGSFYNKQEPDVNKESDIQPDIGSYSVRKEGTLKYKEGKKMEKDGRYRLIMPTLAGAVSGCGNVSKGTGGGKNGKDNGTDSGERRNRRSAGQ